MQKKLTTREEAFCLELIRTDNKTNSLVNVWRKIYKPKSKNVSYHRSKASAVFNKPHIQNRITELRKKLIDKIEIEAADILRHWASIVKADVTEIVRIEKNCCRHCYGINYFYQWSEIEWTEKLDKLDDQTKLPKPPRGGFGFNAKLPPNKLCPVCCGDGKEQLFFADTRYLSADAKLLFLGVKQKNDGSIEILLDDRKDARIQLAKVLGMYEPNWKPPGSGEMENTKLTVETLDPQAAANTYQRIMKG
jgi:phage terminase small subunit